MPRTGRLPLLLAVAAVVATSWLGALPAPAPRDRLPATVRPAPTEGDIGVPAPAAPAAPPAPPVLQVRYRIEIRSPDPALADAAQVIDAVLEDPRGWQQADIDFVADPGAPHVIVLAEGADAHVLCQPYDVGGRFSCQNGPLVVLNAIRWREAVPHWPGDLASYRQMLVNHEVGHLLGMHHLRCTAPGAVAPVMEQQSGTLRGCQANAWPTPVELRLAATHQFRIAPPPVDVPFPP